MMKWTVVGDVVAGRLIDREYHRDPAAFHPLKSVAQVCQGSELMIFNLESALHPPQEPVSLIWPKAFRFYADPQTLKSILSPVGDIKLHCSLANNHILDAGISSGIDFTPKKLNEMNISHAGCGSDLFKAMEPAIVELPNGVRIGFLSLSDHPSEWAASLPKQSRITDDIRHGPMTHAGIWYFDAMNFTKSERARVFEAVSRLKTQVDLIVCSLHWGPNYQWEPSLSFQHFAHELIDHGVDMIHGHSAHHFQGIEIYKHRPIMYSCGDFLDDYAVDEWYRNDLGFVFQPTWHRDENTGTWVWAHLDMFPTQIRHFQTFLLDKDSVDFQHSCRVMRKLCADMGTKVLEMTENGRCFLRINACSQ